MNLENMKLLIVDDETDLCEVLSWDFEELGVKVIKANSGNSAIEILNKEKIDIVLTDIKMPEGDGVELLEYIYKNISTIKAVYLMTGYSDYPEQKLTEIGMRKLFKKPVRTEDIIEDILTI